MVLFLLVVCGSGVDEPSKSQAASVDSALPIGLPLTVIIPPVMASCTHIGPKTSHLVG